jgi:hypothetical protein
MLRSLRGPVLFACGLVAAVGCSAPTTGSGTSPTSAADSAVDTGSPTTSSVPGGGPGSLVPPSSIAGESSWCWFVAPDRHRLGLFAVGMDSGTIEPVGAWPSVNRTFHTAGLAYTGSSLVMVGYAGSALRWYELDLATGTLNQGPEVEPSVSVTSLDGALVVVGQSDLVREPQVYDDFAALSAGTPSGTLPGSFGFGSTRVQIAGDEWFTAWHSTNEVAVLDVATGQPVETVSLERYDTWVWGIGVVGDRIHLIDDGRGHHDDGDVWISRFERSTGALVSEVSLGSVASTLWPSGLYCDGPDR